MLKTHLQANSITIYDLLRYISAQCGVSLKDNLEYKKFKCVTIRQVKKKKGMNEES